MERKIGEIFEYKGEWLQCVEQPEKYDKTVCTLCAFQGTENCDIDECSDSFRSDKQDVIFKKLEKVGKPYEYFVHGSGIIMVQEYIIGDNPKYIRDAIDDLYIFDCQNGRIAIEIKQNKEDMEENKLNLKPFDIQKAREGKPVCTRDGRKARIICFDRINGDYYKIVACVTAFDGDFEEVLFYGIDGYIVDSQNPKDEDLMMLPGKKEGWVNVYKTSINYECGTVFSTEQEAKNKANNNRIATIRIEWEE